MNIAELLRKLADTIDANSQSEDPGAPDPKLQNPAELIAVEPESVEEPCEVCGEEPCGCESDVEEQPDDVYVPPLQLKLELLKKATGVESVYDETEKPEDQEQSGPETYGQAPEQDELGRLRQLAAVVRSEASDDEPLDS